MKILGISGGTKDGANDCMCKEALLSAETEGAEIEFIRLNDLNIMHCTGCKACVMSLFSGKGNMCVLKDDFDWLLDQMMDADGIIFSIPVFEKCAMGKFHTIMDRFGPRMGHVHNVIATQMAEEGKGKQIDPRYIQPRVVSYMGIGGSDWTTQVQCDFGIHALTAMWKVIDNEVFPWSLGILRDEKKVLRAREIGKNLAEAAADLPGSSYRGDEGVCPHCHSRNFFFHKDGRVICGICGVAGKMVPNGDGYLFEFPEEQLEHAHDTVSGQFIHAEDIQRNEGEAGGQARSDAYKAKVKYYSDAVKAVVPEADWRKQRKGDK